MFCYFLIYFFINSWEKNVYLLKINMTKIILNRPVWGDISNNPNISEGNSANLNALSPLWSSSSASSALSFSDTALKICESFWSWYIVESFTTYEGTYTATAWYFSSSFNNWRTYNFNNFFEKIICLWPDTWWWTWSIIDPNTQAIVNLDTESVANFCSFMWYQWPNFFDPNTQLVIWNDQDSINTFCSVSFTWTWSWSWSYLVTWTDIKTFSSIIESYEYNNELWLPDIYSVLYSSLTFAWFTLLVYVCYWLFRRFLSFK